MIKILFLLRKVLHNLSTLANLVKMKKIVIVGGGLAGLLSAVQLSRAGIECTLIEKREYPFHRVCGEYISNEVVPFLQSLDAFPEPLHPSSINRFQLSATNGKSSFLQLDLGGFGISRFAFDYFLYERAKALGVTFLLNTEVEQVDFNNEKFTIRCASISLEADVVIGSHGKRSKVDMALKRSFIQKRSPYVGVKYHVRTDFPTDLVALHNFEGGYCGANNVENDITNLCYLVHRDVVRKQGGIEALETQVLKSNPHLKYLFDNSDFLFDKPETINEITFETKEPVYNHMLMAGDAAGMITPLCGNGMAMAIHASKIVSDLIIQFCKDKNYTRLQLESDYARKWKMLFERRLWQGRQIQKLFGSALASNISIHLLLYSKPLAKSIVKRTHGEVF
jgi:menaquinone-9 beta-reductase